MSQFDPNSTSAFSLKKIVEPYQSGPLDGITFAVKDLIDTQGDVTSCGNPSWHQKHEPAVINAVCVDQCLAAGARCVGKTKTNEFAFGLTGENDFYGTALNPNAPDRIPGGSSAGSASAVASGACDFALGTDTGGSVRVPASNCGVWGMRTTTARISVAGVNPLATSYDSVGVFAKDIDTLNLATRCLLGSNDNGNDQEINQILLPIDIIKQCDTEVADCADKWFNQLAKHYSVREVTLSDCLHTDTSLRELFNHYCQIHWCEIWSSLGDWVEKHQPELGSATKINFQLAKNADRTHLFKAFQFRDNINQHINQLLANNNLLLLPSTPAIPPIKGQVNADRTKGDYIPRLSGISSLAAFARSPQVSLPIAHINSVPQGLGLMAATGCDEFVLQACTKIARLPH
ncbi:MAG: amidase family protein [Coxiellaceae bacterium]|nr:amidase family protein [Coxiellaceae bacterium]